MVDRIELLHWRLVFPDFPQAFDRVEVGLADRAGNFGGDALELVPIVDVELKLRRDVQLPNVQVVLEQRSLRHNVFKLFKLVLDAQRYEVVNEEIHVTRHQQIGYEVEQ